MGEVLTVADAAAVIRAGGVVVVPTETVYGLVARPDQAGVARIVEIKRRPSSHALQLLVPDAGWLDRLSRPPDAARALAAAFWPGPLTLVVPSTQDSPRALVSDGTIGLRVPANLLALELLSLTGPLAGSSANRSGEPTPATLDQIRALLGTEVDGYLDGGTIDGPGSTVVGFSDGRPVVLREGALRAGQIERLCRSAAAPD